MCICTVSGLVHVMLNHCHVVILTSYLLVNMQTELRQLIEFLIVGAVQRLSCVFTLPCARTAQSYYVSFFLLILFCGRKDGISSTSFFYIDLRIIEAYFTVLDSEKKE